MRNSKRNGPIKLISALLLSLLFLFPIYIMVLSALKPSNEIFNMKLIPNLATMTLDNFKLIFQESNFARSILNSFIVATTVTVAAICFHSMAGFALAKMKFRFKNGLFIWFISTMMIPFSVIMIPMFSIVKAMGLMNSLWGIMLPLIPNAYGIFLYRQFFLNMPLSFMEAARIDGMSDMGIFWKIYFPLSKSITISLGISFFVANWNAYLWPLIVTQKEDLWVIQVAMATFKQEHTTSWNLILSGAVIAALPTLVLFFLFRNFIKDGISATGNKE